MITTLWLRTLVKLTAFIKACDGTAIAIHISDRSLGASAHCRDFEGLVSSLRLRIPERLSTEPRFRSNKLS